MTEEEEEDERKVENSAVFCWTRNRNRNDEECHDRLERDGSLSPVSDTQPKTFLPKKVWIFLGKVIFFQMKMRAISGISARMICTVQVGCSITY